MAVAAPPPSEGPKLTKPPELVTFVEAEFPPSEREAGRSATVTLRLHIDAEGVVQTADIVDSAGEAFDAAARAAVLAFRFTPAEIDGKPAPIQIVYRYAFTFTPEVIVPTTATLTGHVIRRGTSEALPGVAVELRPPGTDPPRVVTTDADGRFTFEEVPIGDVGISLSGERLTSVSTTETLEPGQVLEVSYEVSLQPIASPDEPVDDFEILVVAPPMRRAVLSTSMKAEEARQVPGTSGDVVRVVENLPGVARSTAGTGQLVVWGASPQDTRVYIDGVPIPRLYHEGGFRSVVYPWFVSNIELVPGGQGAPWGRGLGGMVSVTTRSRGDEKLSSRPTGAGVSGRVQADIIDASLALATPLGKRKKVGLAFALRGSYLQLWADAIRPTASKALIPIPNYGDGQIRLRYQPSSRDHIDVVALASLDRFSRGVPHPDPALAIQDERSLDFVRVYARYEHDDGHGAKTTTTPFFGFSRAAQSTSFGPTTTTLRGDVWLAGLRINHSRNLRKWVTLDLGVDAELDVTESERVGSLGLPPREGDVRVFGQPPPDQISGDTWTVTRIGIAPYVDAVFITPGGKLSVTPGLRIDPNVRAVSRRNPPAANTPSAGLFEYNFAFEPRLAVVVRPIERLQLRAATGLYRQQPAAEDLSAAFGNPTLPTARALHTVLGAAVNIVETLSLELTGFYTQSNRLAMRNLDDAPLQAEALEPLGYGRAYGVQTLLRLDLFKGFFGWVAYTLMRAERRNDEGAWRLFDFDQTHVLTAVLAYATKRRFEVSARFRYASGFPRSPVVGSYLDATDNRYQPIFGDQNSIRIPDFVQLDLRVAKVFTIRKTTLEVFLEVLNLWNRSNAEEIIYSPDFQERGYIRGFPILPVLGVQWDF